MARSGNITVENNFTKGLITEYTAMNFPENAVTETDNCVYSELGTVTRRLGIDYETGAVVRSLASIGASVVDERAVTEFRWFAVGNDGTTTFVVQQIGRAIRFFADTGAISPNLKSFDIDLMDYKVVGSTSTQVISNACQFTTGDGYLFITHPFCDPLYVSYDGDTDTIDVNEITIEIRDIEGLDEDVENDERPTVLTNTHKYNLYNQGWNTDVPNLDGFSENALVYWERARTDYPSNADVWWLYRGSRGWVSFLQGATLPEDGVSPDSIKRGNSPAPRGYYIYEAFDIDRSEKSGITGLPGQTAGISRPGSCAWYAGRVWFSGVKATKYSSSLYFSQLVEGPRQFGKCYQQNDPTSEVAFDIVDTDGGVIKLPLVEEVVAMKVLGDSLVVLATNCVYVVSGTANDAFKTTNYTVRYISSVGARSALSVVEAEGALVWWNYDGIYSLTVTANGPEITNISKQTIQSFLTDIPADNIQFVKGVYNRREQIIRWIFSNVEESRYSYNRILDLNLASKAFYPHTIGTTLAPRICGLLTVSGATLVQTNETVVDSLGATVTDSSGTTTILVEGFSGAREIFKFVISGLISGGSLGLTYGELKNSECVDWESFNAVGESYSSYGISGYRIRGEMLRQFTSTPVAFVMKNVVGGSCLVSGIWNYGERQSLKQELYRAATSVTNYIRRLNIRGRGKSFQIKFESAGNAPFSLVGWSTLDTGGTQP